MEDISNRYEHRGAVKGSIDSEGSINSKGSISSKGSIGSIGSSQTNSDEINDEKNYGTCQTCKRYYTNYEWCQACSPISLTKGWTSDNEAIDEIIKSTQLKATGYNNYNYLEWISYNDLVMISEIGEGGFATIYKAIWKNGGKTIDENKKRCASDKIIALKKFHTPEISKEFLKEFQNYVIFHQEKCIIHIYGITKDPVNNQYIFVMDYKEEGNLHDYLLREYKILKWKDKVGIVSNIIKGLKTIHKQKIIHHDLHSGNILHKKKYHFITTFIADLGLSCPVDQQLSNKSIYGVLPYIAPEVLRGEPYIMASDIYSFGALMSEISTGQRPFSNVSHDSSLVSKICEGVRPGFSNNTPSFYKALAYKCMDDDPANRPTAEQIGEILDFWKPSFNNYVVSSKNHDYYNKDQLDEIRSKRKEFDEMDKIGFDPSTIGATIHPNAIFTSRLLRFSGLSLPINRIRERSYDSLQKYLDT